MDFAFLSFSSKDAEVASDLASALEERGQRVFFSPASIVAGTSFVTEISKALDECDGAIVLWSRQANASPWVQREVDTLADRGIASNGAFPLFIVALDDTKPPAVLRTVQRLGIDGSGVGGLAARILGVDAPRAGSCAPTREAIRVAQLTEHELRSIAALLRNGGTDMRAKAVPPVVRWRTEGTRTIVAEVSLASLDAEPGRLSGIKVCLDIITRHELEIDHLRVKKASPLNTFYSLQPEIDERESQKADEVALLRTRLNACLAHLWVVEEARK